MNVKENEKKLKKKGKKRKVLIIILSVIFIPIFLFLGYRLISNMINEMEVKKFNNTLNELAKERTDYVFIEINPSFVLTVKNNKVTDVACLNDDCVSIYEDVNIKDKTLNESIDVIYTVSKEKGYDVSNGVKVKTSNNVNIESEENVTIEHINGNQEKELLNEVKNNENIKNVNNSNYYNDLWEELKKDGDYDKSFSCSMVDNKLGCYLTDLIVIPLEENLANFAKTNNGMLGVFQKFGIKYESWNWSEWGNFVFPVGPYGVYIDETFYYIVHDVHKDYVELVNYGNIPECQEYFKNGMPTRYVTCATTFGNSSEFSKTSLGKFNLLTGQIEE